MNTKWREAFIAHSKTDLFKDRVAEGERIISDALRKYRKPYVAFSGGKDSTCVLHLVLQQSPKTMVLHWDYGRYYIPREMHKEIIEIIRKLGAVNVRIETSQRYEELKRQAVGVLGEDMIGRLIPQLMEEGYDCCFVGLRKEESFKRRRRMNAGKSLTSIKEFWPIGNWTWMDVWAYIISYKIPYLSHYDKYANVVGWSNARFATFFDPEFDKYGCCNIDGVLNWRFKNIS